MRFVKVCAVATAFVLTAPFASADTAPKPQADVATLLFGKPHWDQAPVGSTISYAYSKKTTQAVFGPSFNDKIVLQLEKGEDDKSRTAEVKMFTGANAKPAGPFHSEQQNPVLLLVMEENVQELSKLFKANPRYLKNAIRKAWRDDAKIVDTPVMFDGKSVPGTRITVKPFVNDTQKDRMMELDGMSYTVEIADSVPGTIARIDIKAPSDGKPPIFEETLVYQGTSK